MIFGKKFNQFRRDVYIAELRYAKVRNVRLGNQLFFEQMTRRDIAPGIPGKTMMLSKPLVFQTVYPDKPGAM